MFGRNTAFWRAVSGSSLSALRDAEEQFATLLPPAGDAYLRVQRVPVDGGCHLDLAPQTLPDGTEYWVDQVCLDVPADRFEMECQFWSRLTSWGLQGSSLYEEFRFLARPSWSPLRLLLRQRPEPRPRG